MRRRISLVLLVLLVFALAGCGPKPIVPSTATVTGYVTLYRGGVPVEGAKVKGPGIEVFTDAKGYFSVSVNAEEEINLLITKDGFATGKIQDIYLLEGTRLDLEIPIREIFYPELSITPPTIEVTGVVRGDTVAGDLDIQVKVNGDGLDTYVFYVYFCGLQRSPVEFNRIDANEGEGTIDTTLFPNGVGFVRILAYDTNGNSTTLIIPVLIENEIEEPAEDLPADLQWFGLNSTTIGSDFGYYSKGRQGTSGLANGIMDVGPGSSTLYIVLEWSASEGADGYYVYRGVTEEDLKLISYIPSNKVNEDDIFVYQDFSPLLTPEVPVFYKVVPSNTKGVSAGIQRSVTPLEPLIVNLKEPAHLSSNVPLQPTFKWESNIEATDEISIEYDFFLRFATIPLGIREKLIDVEEYTLEDELLPGGVYSWDITEAVAYTLDEDETGYSYACSLAGIDNGSINGEFIFTTTLEVEE